MESGRLREVAHGAADFIDGLDEPSSCLRKLISMALRDACDKQREILNELNKLRGD